MESRTIPEEFRSFLRQAGLCGPDESPAGLPLTGGVSSDIWRVECAGEPICVKRALAKLKVDADWFAPIERNAFEASWMQRMGQAVPGAAPEILAHDATIGMFAMPFLDPASHRVWKAALLNGEADAEFADAVGRALARIHRDTFNDPETARQFATDDIFHAIRLEPYLEAAARAHKDVAAEVNGLVRVTAGTRSALVHGDVSPKNILIGPNGPVFLDAECAWYGDPAFDLAFCLNHLLLKCIPRPDALAGFMASFETLAGAYSSVIGAPDANDIEARAARLLPGLLLARVDGKSPVEYIAGETGKDRVRRVAKRLLRNPVSRLSAVSGAWRREFAR